MKQWVPNVFIITSVDMPVTWTAFIFLTKRTQLHSLIERMLIIVIIIIEINNAIIFVLEKYELQLWQHYNWFDNNNVNDGINNNNIIKIIQLYTLKH